MRAMKDSGVEWIGEIPSDWTIKRIKNLADSFQKDSFIDGDWIESPDITDEGIRYLTTGNIGDGMFKRQGNSFISADTFSRLNCKYAYPEDFVIARLNAPHGRSCILPNDYNEYVLAVDIVILRTREDKRFLCYLSQCAGYQKSVEDESKGTTMKRISRTNLGRIPLPIPPLTEQRRIADFLDRRCAEIDRVIDATQQTIAEYKALKQSIITEAVTKGVRGPRPMKDSGVEWIGEIPSEWKLVPFRYVLMERSEKNNPIVSTERLSLSIDLGVTLYADKTTNLDRFKDDFSQYKIAHAGDLVMNSMNMIVGATGVSAWTGCVSPVYYTFYDNLPDHVTAKYCEYIFRSKTMLRVLYSLGKGIYAIERGDDRVNTCRLKVSKEDLKSILIPLPSIQEQREIVQFLANKSSEVDSLIASKQQLLNELESYKKSVIYEYVTGKKEVPAC